MIVNAFIEQSNEADSEEALILQLMYTLKQFGYGGFIYRYQSTPQNPALRNFQGVITNYCPEWVKFYNEQGYFTDDPIFNNPNARHSGVITFDEAAKATQNKKQELIMNQRREHGLVTGAGAVLSGPCGENIAFAVCSDIKDLPADRNTLSQLFAIGNQFNLRFTHLKTINDPLPEIALSKREKEVLLWCCKGKSNSIIATLLGISEKTVEYHFSEIFRKLDVNNRILAALKAVSYKLISV